MIYDETGEPVGESAGYMDWELTLARVTDEWKVSYVENEGAARCAA